MAAGHKVTVCLLSYRWGPSTALRAINSMVSHSRKQGTVVEVLMGGSALVHKERNQQLAEAPFDATHLLFLDDDMVPTKDALERLLAHNMPVVSALCTTRVPPVRLAVHAYDERSDQFAPMHYMKPGKVHVGYFGLGAAFLLMDRATADILIEDHLSAADWMAANRRMFDRMHVRAEVREKERARREQIRRTRFLIKDYVLRVFDFGVTDDEVQFGEDVHMSRSLIRLKIKVAIDPDTKVGHMGEYPWSPDDVDYSDYTPEMERADRAALQGAA